MLSTEDIREWSGRDLVGSDEQKIGAISEVYVDRETGEPTFVSVKTGLLGTRSSFVPIHDARSHEGHVDVPYSKDLVKDAPNVDDDEELSPSEEQRLYEHYSLAYSGTDPSTEATDSASPGHDTSGPNTDEAMTRSEEELRVGTRSTESGRARLHKYVDTERVSTTVPVSHEEATIVREPITDANVDAATSGASLSEEEHEVVLHAEEPVVEKTVVPKERVRLDTETVTEDTAVEETLRKERIESEGGATAR